MQDQNTTPCNITQLPTRKDALTESVISRHPRKQPTVDLTLLAELFKEHYLAGDCDDDRSITEQYWSWLTRHAPAVIEENPPLVLIESLAVAGKPVEESRHPSAALVAIARIWREQYCPQNLFIESGDDVPSRFMKFLKHRRPNVPVGTTAQRITAIITAELQLIQKDRAEKW